MHEPRGRILVVDDDQIAAQVHSAVLAKAGYETHVAASGEAAIAAVREINFDVIVTDLAMPGIDGIELIREIRQTDLDVPIILVTAAPTLDSAIRAVEYGALRYLLKPVDHEELQTVVGKATQLRRMAELKKEALALTQGGGHAIGDRAGLDVEYSRALESASVHYQPIVSWSEKKVFAYEALIRSKEPSLPHPGALIDAGERLGRIFDLGRRVRSLAPKPFDDRVELLFLNLHPADLGDDDLFKGAGDLANMADRVVLEVTERASLEGLGDVHAKVGRLRDLGFRIALDDLGSGYAGLNSFSQLEPEVVKLDMSLVRGVQASPTKQALIRSMHALCREMNILLVCEGVETPEERDTLTTLGCDLLQGFLFGRPNPLLQPAVDL